MALTPIGTDDDLEGYFATYGIESWADHGAGEIAESVVLDQCKVYAGGLIAGKLSKRYTYAVVRTAPMMIEIWCVIVLRTLCFRRGNPPPASLEFRYQEIMAKEDGLLAQIADGSLPLTDENGDPLRPKNSNGPSWANLHVDRWYPESKVRVITGNSDMTTSRLPRKTDRFPESFG